MLPFKPKSLVGRTAPAARATLTVVPALVLAAVLASPQPADSQIALEVESGATRIWSGSGPSERVAMSPDRLPRVAVAAEGGHIIAGDDSATGNLFFIQRSGGLSIDLPTPPSRIGELRSSPVLIAAGGRLEGSAWLEGTNQQDFTILASAWNGTSWETVETVSIQKTGPQLALAMTMLDDGTWLLLWAGYDGTDDDIFWSRRTDRTWSKPRRLHANNQVPDILPAVTTHGGIAHAAWNHFDGHDYRIRTARWTGSGWAVDRTLEGRGSGRAAFETVAERSFLTYQTVEPNVWNLVEFGRSGPGVQRAVPQPHSERPLVVLDKGVIPTLAWPWREARP